MRKIPPMVDMRRTPAEKAEDAAAAIPTAASMPDYPWGLKLALEEPELTKLNLDMDDVEVGDMVHLHCMAKVTSVSRSDNEVTGRCCRTELTITHIAAEDEENEDDEEGEKEPSRRSKLYG